MGNAKIRGANFRITDIHCPYRTNISFRAPYNTPKFIQDNPYHILLIKTLFLTSRCFPIWKWYNTVMNYMHFVLPKLYEFQCTLCHRNIWRQTYAHSPCHGMSVTTTLNTLGHIHKKHPPGVKFIRTESECKVYINPY